MEAQVEGLEENKQEECLQADSNAGDLEKSSESNEKMETVEQDLKEEDGHKVEIKVEEEEIKKEDEPEKKVDEVKKEEEESSQSNSDMSTSEDDMPRVPMRRTYRVPQKNRYYQDFHCTNLTRGARGKLDDYDSFTTTAGTRSSNRRSTTDLRQEETEVFASKYCRKCASRTAHDLYGGCQNCLYKKIVESSRRQKPASQRNRSGNNRRQKKATANTINTNTNSDTTKNTNIDSNNISTTNIDTNIVENNDSIISNNDPIYEVVPEININGGFNNTDDNKLPKLDSWTPDEVADYIMSKGFADEAELFKTQSVDGISLLLMQRTDFTYGLKIKLGPALKIYDQVCKLKKEYFRTVPVSQQ